MRQFLLCILDNPISINIVFCMILKRILFLDTYTSLSKVDGIIVSQFQTRSWLILAWLGSCSNGTITSSIITDLLGYSFAHPLWLLLVDHFALLLWNLLTLLVRNTCARLLFYCSAFLSLYRTALLPTTITLEFVLCHTHDQFFCIMLKIMIVTSL